MTSSSRGLERKNDVARVEGDFPEDISSIQSKNIFERELKVEKGKKRKHQGSARRRRGGICQNPLGTDPTQGYRFESGAGRGKGRGEP